MTVFFTEKTSFCDFLQVYAHSGLKFTWQMYLQHLTLRSKFEVFIAQPLPKLTTATSHQLHLLSLTVMDIGYFSYFLFLYLLDKETQHDTYLNPCSEFTLNFLDSIYSQMTPFRERSFLS